MKTTLGNILFNEALPRQMRDYGRSVSGKNLGDVLTTLADKFPQNYPSAVYDIKKLGDNTSYLTGHSIGLEDFAPPKEKKAILAKTKKELAVLDKKKLSSKEREREFTQIMGKNKKLLEKAVLDKGRREKSGLAEIVFSKSRGSPDQLNSIQGSPMAVQDSKGETIQVPIDSSYAEGLDPAEYWAASYGTRKGVLSTKVATAEGGYFGKRLASPTHRLLVATKDCGTNNGISEELDGDILDCYLAKAVGPFSKNDIITREMLDTLKKKKVERVLVRSPLTCEEEEGLCSKCRGIIETGKEPEIGMNVGINSALTISEPVAQGAMNVKHKGGALQDKDLEEVNLETLKRLVDVPKAFPDQAVLSELDGKVTKIEKAPQGGQYLYVDDTAHYVSQKRQIKVKINSKVLKGDVLTNGIVNPSDVVRLKGLGPARMFFTKYYKDIYKRALGKDLHQKHFETFTRGMLNYVEVKDPEDSDELLPGDKISIQKASKIFKSKKSEKLPPEKALGKWLVKQYLHYTIGTEVSKYMVEEFKKVGIKEIEVSSVKPSFEPVMVRLNAVADADSDWIRRLGGERLREGLIKAVSKGEISKIKGTSYLPGLAYGAEFGGISEEGKY